MKLTSNANSEETPSTTHADDDAQRSFLPPRSRRNNERTAPRKEPLFAPFIPSQKSRTRNTVSNMQHLVSPQNTPPNKCFCPPSPFNRETRYRPLMPGLGSDSPASQRTLMDLWRINLNSVRSAVSQLPAPSPAVQSEHTPREHPPSSIEFLCALPVGSSACVPAICAPAPVFRVGKGSRRRR